MRAFIATVPITLMEIVNFVITENIEDADLYVVDVLKDSEAFYERTLSTGLFKNVFFVENILLTYPITVSKCLKTLKNGREFIREASDREYEEVYYSNSGWLINSIFYTAFLKRNPDIKNYFLEHGRYSYTCDYEKKSWYIGFLIRLLGMKCMNGKMLEKLYLFHPELMETNTSAQIIKMHSFDRHNSALVNVLNQIFEYKKEDDEFLNKEYIIIEDAPQIVEYDKQGLWQEVFKYIDKSKCIIKAHPRQKDSELRDFGINVCENYTIPWELELLNIDVSNKMQITVFSSAGIAPKMYFDEEPRSVFLQKLVPSNAVEAQRTVLNFVEKTQELFVDKSKFFMPSTFDELGKYLEELSH